MDAIFLDIDGTLWDSTYTVAEAWNEVLEKKPELNLVITPELLKTLFGRPLPEIAAVIFAEYDKKTQIKLIDECCEKEHEFLDKKPRHTLLTRVCPLRILLNFVACLVYHI